jgi:hypothetical protein
MGNLSQNSSEISDMLQHVNADHGIEAGITIGEFLPYADVITKV